jgi:hypothetical protein
VTERHCPTAPATRGCGWILLNPFRYPGLSGRLDAVDPENRNPSANERKKRQKRKFYRWLPVVRRSPAGVTTNLPRGGQAVAFVCVHRRSFADTNPRRASDCLRLRPVARRDSGEAPDGRLRWFCCRLGSFAPGRARSPPRVPDFRPSGTGPLPGIWHLRCSPHCMCESTGPKKGAPRQRSTGK